MLRHRDVQHWHAPSPRRWRSKPAGHHRLWMSARHPSQHEPGCHLPRHFQSQVGRCEWKPPLSVEPQPTVLHVRARHPPPAMVRLRLKVRARKLVRCLCGYRWGQGRPQHELTPCLQQPQRMLQRQTFRAMPSAIGRIPRLRSQAALHSGHRRRLCVKHPSRDPPVAIPHPHQTRVRRSAWAFRPHQPEQRIPSPGPHPHQAQMEAQHDLRRNQRVHRRALHPRM